MYAGPGGVPIRAIVLVPAALLLLVPAATAGSADAPEITDPADDCGFAYGNHYADIVSAWISDETSTGFNVNIALSKWTADPLGAMTGYTVQFEHQGTQFGVAAFYDGQTWQYSNAFIDVETGEMSEFKESTGSFAPGSPALITVLFDKGHFPHTNAADNKLVKFTGGSADFKTFVPWFLAPIPVAPPATPLFFCDAVASDATYTFQTGGHSAHAAPADAGGTGNATAEGDAAANATAGTDGVAPAAAPEPAADRNDSPFPAAPGLAAALLGALALRRRTRRA